MLSVHKKYKELIQDVFNGDQSFIGALDKACASVVNHRPNPKMACRSPEMVGMIYDKNSFFFYNGSIIYYCVLLMNLKKNSIKYNINSVRFEDL
jgi:hypothetical protein